MSSATKKEQVQDHIERGKEEAASMMDKVKDTVKDTAAQVGQTVGNVATTVGHKAEDATASVGKGMENLGKKVREKGPESGILGKATEGIAGALETGGKYLEDKNLSGMGEDITNLIRRNPLPAVLIGIGLGFLLARTIRS